MSRVSRALISVYDKTGLVPFAKALSGLGIEIISTGRTWRALKEEGIAATEVSEVTGFPEMLDGRVKTLHPKIHAGILAMRSKSEHMSVLKENRIAPIDLVVVSLYPFEETLKKTQKHDEIIEMIDIGGPSMLRGAAKNYTDVAAICDVSDYDRVLEELASHDRKLSLETRRYLAGKVFGTVAGYDQMIHDYFESLSDTSRASSGRPAVSVMGGEWRLSAVQIRSLRYGENPHQKASLYKVRGSGEEAGLCDADVLGGKELSYNNYLDLESAWTLVSEFEESACAIMKHNNPCGFALDESPEAAFKRAFDCDPLSAFGGIVAFNRPVSAKTAATVLKAGFLECILAPDYDAKALELFKTKKNLRLCRLKPRAKKARMEWRRITGGVLVQESDHADSKAAGWKCPTAKKPTASQLKDLEIAFRLCPYVKSNAIILVKKGQTVGIGMGQTSRVDSAITALRKAGKRAKGSVLASDGFFPKPDSILFAKKGGIAAIVQPGGSIQDEAVIKACNQARIPMLMTGIRHFSH